MTGVKSGIMVYQQAMLQAVCHATATTKEQLVILAVVARLMGHVLARLLSLGSSVISVKQAPST